MNPIGVLVEEALSDIDVPISRLNYSGAAQSYIVYFEYGTTTALRGDDQELKYRSGVQVDIYSPYDLTELTNSVVSKMKEKGFTMNFANEYFETDTGLYHKVISYYYLP